MALPKQNRLKKKKDFEAVFKNGTTLKGRFLLVKTSKNHAENPKVGFIISSKVAKKAVDRNRVKRVLAEGVQKMFQKIKSDTIVLVLRVPLPREMEKEKLLNDLNLTLS